MKKRILSLFLAVLMIASLLPAGVFAEKPATRELYLTVNNPGTVGSTSTTYDVHQGSASGTNIATNITLQNLFASSARKLHAPVASPVVQDGDILHLPKGTFYEGGIVDVYDNVTIVGAGESETILVGPVGTSNHFFRIYNRYAANITNKEHVVVTFKDLTLDGQDKTKGRCGIVCTCYNIDLTVENVTIKNFRWDAIGLWGNDTLYEGGYPTKADHAGITVTARNLHTEGNGNGTFKFDVTPTKDDVQNGRDRFGFATVTCDEECTLNDTTKYYFGANAAGQQNCFLNDVDLMPPVAKIGSDKFFGSLADAIAAAEAGETVTMLTDVNENVTVSAGKTMTLDLNGKTVNGGTADKTKAAITNNGTLTVTGNGTIKRIDTNESGYYVIDNQGTLTFDENFTGKVTNGSGSTVMHAGASVIRNGSETDPGTRATLNIKNGTFEQTNFNVIKSEEYSIINISGGTITCERDFAILSYDDLTISGGTVNGPVCTRTYGTYDAITTISGGTINGDVISAKYNSSAVNAPVVTVTDGYIKKLTTDDPQNATNGRPGTISVSGGYFVSDPSEFVQTGKAAVSSDVTGYGFAIADKVTSVETTAQAGTPELVVDENASEEVKEVAEAIQGEIAAAVQGAEDLLPDARDVANDSTVMTEEIEKTAKEALNVASGTNVTLIVQPYFEIAVTEAESEPGVASETNITSVTFDIKAKYNLLATTATETELTSENTRTLASASDLEVTQPVTLTLPLPQNFVTASGKVYIKHVKEDEKVYIYEGTVTEEGGKKFVTFVNPNGFSGFTVTPEITTVAGIERGGNEMFFETFAEAVNEVADGETIKLIASGTNLTATVSRKVSFTLDRNGQTGLTGSIAAGTGYKNTGSGDSYVFTEQEYSTYQFVVTVPETLKVEEEYAGASVAVKYATESDLGYSHVQVLVEMTAKPSGSNPGIWATDTAGNQFNIAETGKWGPDTGFPIAKNYNVTTNFNKLVFDKAGTYTATFRLVDKDNSDAVLCQSSKTITVERADITPVVTLNGWTYGEAANAPAVTGNTGNGAVTYEYKPASATDYTTATPTNAGNYVVKATVATSTDYNGGCATANFTIAKKAVTVTAKDKAAYVGEEKPVLSTATDLTVTGLVGADKLAGSVTLGYASGINMNRAGTYAIEVTGDENAAGENYIVSYVNGTLTVSTKPDPGHDDPAPVKPIREEPVVNPFVDVRETQFFYDAVLWAVKNKIAAGTDETHFMPLDITTRAQMVTFLWRAAGCPEPTITICAFTDVLPEKYYYKAVLWAVEKGIAKGVTETQFAPKDPVTRSQAVTFLARYAGITDEATGYSSSFMDVKAGKYYYNAVVWAANHGITKGTTETTFGPNDNCLRGQMIAFLYRFLGK